MVRRSGQSQGGKRGLGGEWGLTLRVPQTEGSRRVSDKSILMPDPGIGGGRISTFAGSALGFTGAGKGATVQLLDQ